jgi:cytochrome o ubiquinol oxidase subunit 2
MGKAVKISLSVLALCILLALGWKMLSQFDFAVLNPKGIIASKERNLLITATLLMLIVVVPAYALTIFIAWRYREGNGKAKYTPEWNHSTLAEAIWWGLPFLIIVILAGITWKSSHELNPFNPLQSEKKPLHIQVVALQWKWLFLYPEQGIATVNYFRFPEKVPLNFEITGDAPMNSFWIPSLGGQIYAMAGMRTKLHLIAEASGSFRGCSANISGAGFASMNFTAEACSEEAFEAWVEKVKSSPVSMGFKEYEQLVPPTEYVPVSQYVLTESTLFDRVIQKYMP